MSEVRRASIVFVLLLSLALAIALLPLTWAGVLVAGGVVLLTILVHPQVALYLLIFAVPFGSLREVQVGGITFGLTEGLIALLLAAWLAKMIAARQVCPVWPPLTLPLLLFLGVILLTLPETLSLTLAGKEILKWVEVLGVYLFVANALSRRQAMVAVIALLMAGVGQALLGAYQFFRQVGPEHFVLFRRFMRAYGTFQQPNPYAGYLGLVLPVGVGLLMWAVTERGGRSWFRVVGLLAAIGLLTAALGMSWSRGAWLGFAAALVAVNGVRSRQAAMVLATLLGVAVLILALGGVRLLPPALIQRFTDFLPFVNVGDLRAVQITDANYAVIERVAHWQAALGMWTDHPWLGVGIGNYAAVYPAYALPKWPDPLGHAHNYYLNIAAEAGLIGLLAYLLLWGMAFYQAWKAVRASGGVWQAVAAGVFGVLAHLAVHNFFDNLWVHNMYVHVAVLLGLLTIARRPGDAGT
ncbi:MAG: O-antigen ligase family protein [Anaerolineae bacterium]|nr:O-antigen ligase family protein [Anaerolineae bacterium]MDH7472567.1 O-antigen ligase family protein [Anaerolineae bacterium]